MTNNTDVYWTANAMSLHTKAWSVKSFGGKRWFGPSKKGSNLELPFQRGQVWLPKSRNAQLYDLNMWVLPLNQDGTRDGTLTAIQKAHENWRTITAAVDIEGEFDLVKRWYEGATIMSATARAEFVDGSGPSSDDGRDFYASLQFLLADPYFYLPVASFAAGGTFTALGEVPSDHVTVTFTAGTNPRLTFNDGNYVQFNGSIGVTPVVVDCKKGLAKVGSTYVNGMITRNTSLGYWPRIFKGSNTLTLSGGAAATIQYDAAFR